MEKEITVHVSGPKLLAVSLSSVLDAFPDIAAYAGGPRISVKGPNEAVSIFVLPTLVPHLAANKAARWGTSAPTEIAKRPPPERRSRPSRVVLIVHGTPDELMAAYAQGYRIFVSVDDDLRTIRQGILAATRGESYCSPLLTPKFADLPSRWTQPETDDTQGIPRERLTKRERNAATLAAAGFSNAEIATQLSISVETVKTHLKEAYKKLGIQRRGQIRM